VAVGVGVKRQRLRGQPHPDYKILHDAGYNVLAYDLRDFGHSGAANGGIASSGIFEARDVAGSLAYARSRHDTRDMMIGLFSRCLGCSSTFAAMTQFPEATSAFPHFSTRCTTSTWTERPASYDEPSAVSVAGSP
jgi:alpha/beta superfamily hydrolase